MQDKTQGARLAGALTKDPRASIQPYPQQPVARIPEQNMPQPMQPQLQRLSPGVYRAPDGSLVNAQGGLLPNQPHRPSLNPQMPPNWQQSMNQMSQGFQPGFGNKPAITDQMNQWQNALPQQAMLWQQPMNQMQQPQTQDVYIGNAMSMPVPMPQQPNPWYAAMQAAYNKNR